MPHEHHPDSDMDRLIEEGHRIHQELRGIRNLLSILVQRQLGNMTAEDEKHAAAVLRQSRQELEAAITAATPKKGS